MASFFAGVLLLALALLELDALTVNQYEKVNMESSDWIPSDSTTDARYNKFPQFKKENSVN